MHFWTEIHSRQRELLRNYTAVQWNSNWFRIILIIQSFSCVCAGAPYVFFFSICVCVCMILYDKIIHFVASVVSNKCASNCQYFMWHYIWYAHANRFVVWTETPHVEYMVCYVEPFLCTNWCSTSIRLQQVMWFISTCFYLYDSSLASQVLLLTLTAQCLGVYMHFDCTYIRCFPP